MLMRNRQQIRIQRHPRPRNNSIQSIPLHEHHLTVRHMIHAPTPLINRNARVLCPYLLPPRPRTVRNMPLVRSEEMLPRPAHGCDLAEVQGGRLVPVAVVIPGSVGGRTRFIE